MAKHTIVLSDRLRLPANLVTESVAILAKRRAGKSTTARRITEQLSRARQQVVVVDPKGDWWGLRYDRTGYHPGLPFIILGGEHGDVPLEPGGASGEIIGRMVVEQRVSIILDLSNFKKPDIPDFMTAFMETLYRLKAAERYRTPVMVVIDEADVIAPQKESRPGQREMISAADDLVRRGGQRGIGVMMITQRSAVLNKDLLTQIGVLIVLRTVAPQDRAAVSLWIDVHGDDAFRSSVMDSLPTLATGEAWIWAPGWPSGEGLFERVQIALPETFDSSYTPDARKTRKLANPAKIDLTALSDRMSATIAHAKENDPRELKAEIADLRIEVTTLKSQIRTQPKAKPDKAPAILKPRDLAQIGKLLNAAKSIEKLADAWQSSAGRLVGVLATVANRPAQAPAPGAIEIPTNLGHRHDVHDAPAPNPTNLGGGEHKMLNAIAQRGQKGVTRSMLSVMIALKRSARDQYISRLKTAKLITVIGDACTVTAEGMKALGGEIRTLPTGRAAIAYWLTPGRLPAPERSIFEFVVSKHPARVSRTDVQAHIGKKRSSTNQYISRLFRRMLIDADAGTVRLSSNFIEP